MFSYLVYINCQKDYSKYFRHCGPTQPSHEFTENGQRKRKYPVSGVPMGENDFLMTGQRTR